MEPFSALLAFRAGNSPVTGEFPSQRPVARSFDVFFDLRLNQQLSKQWRCRWFEMPSRPLWRHYNDIPSSCYLSDCWKWLREDCFYQVGHMWTLKSFIISGRCFSKTFNISVGVFTIKCMLVSNCIMHGNLFIIHTENKAWISNPNHSCRWVHLLIHALTWR